MEIYLFRGPPFKPLQSTLWLPQIHICPAYKIHLPHPTFPNVISTPYNLIFKPKISCKYHNFQISSCKSSEAGISDSVSTVHPRANLFSICGPVQLENKLSASKNAMVREISKIPKTHIPVPKARNLKE